MKIISSPRTALGAAGNSRRLFLLLFLLLPSLLTPLHPAWAQYSRGGDAPASGTVMTAALETVGYHAQGQVLSNLNEMLNYMGALIYVGIIITAVLTVALQGSYRTALWMFVGPPLFAFASGVTFNGYKNQISANGAEWRFGAYNDGTTRRDQLISTETQGRNAQVSWLFHEYNIFVSEISQKLISIATNNDMQKQFLFMARQKTMDDLFGAEIKDSHIQALTGFFMIQCNTEISDARQLALCFRDPTYNMRADCEAAKKRYCDRFGFEDKDVPPGPVMDAIYEVEYANNNKSMPTGFRTVSTSDHLNKLKASHQTVSCAQLWQWVLNATTLEAENFVNDAQIENFDKDAWTYYGDQLLYTTLASIKKKLTDNKYVADYRKNAPQDPCPPKAGNGAQPQDMIMPLVTNTDAQEFVKMVRVMLMRKIMNHPPVQQIWQKVAEGADGIAPNESAPREGETSARNKYSELSRQKSEDFAEARKYETFILIHLMPYLQGFMLYALAVSYPFFAMFLLIPGKAGNFFTWMALWAWAKSWDVGWALIIVADNLLWEFLPKSAYFNVQDKAIYTSPVSLLQGAFDGDPAYTLGTYWMLISAMVTGVPIVTGQFVMGSKKAIGNTLLKGLNTISDAMGNYVTNYYAGFQRARYQQLRSQEIMMNTMDQANRFHSMVMSLNKNSAAPADGALNLQHQASSAGREAYASINGGPLDVGGSSALSALGDRMSQKGSFPQGTAGASTGAAAASSLDGAAQAQAQPNSGLGRAVHAWGDTAQQQKPYVTIWGQKLQGTMAQLDPTGNTAQFLYAAGRAKAAEISLERQLAAMEEVTSSMGLNPKELPAHMQKDQLRSRMRQALIDNHTRTALTAHTAASRQEAVLVATFLAGYGLAGGGPASQAIAARETWLGLETAAGFKRDQIEALRSEKSFQGVIEEQFNSAALFEAAYSPDVIDASLAGAYVSLRRGGEFQDHADFPIEMLGTFEQALSERQATLNFLDNRRSGWEQRNIMRGIWPFTPWGRP